MSSFNTRKVSEADQSRSHPWSHVVIGMWHKYPNPHCAHVLTVDTVDRSVDPKTGIIRTERILGCKQKTPGWIIKVCSLQLAHLHYTHRQLQFFGGSEDAFVREISFVDPATQTATITSVNLSLSQFATCLERIQYSPSRDGHTKFMQSAEIQSRMTMWRTAADRLETWLADRFAQNAHLGKIAFTDVLSRMWEQERQTLS